MNKSLILEGGGMRGIFTAGVLDCFLDENIEFDKCYAVSAGACHACSFLAKQRGRALKVSVDYLDDKRYCSLYSLITTGDLFGKEFVYYKIPNELYPIDNDAYLKNKCEFYSVVTNCKTGKAEYIRINDLKKDIEYIRASSSLPLVSRVVKIDGNDYLDGGISDSIPIKRSVGAGNEKNVVVLTREDGYIKEPNKMMGFMRLLYKKYPALSEAIEKRHKMYNETLEYIKEAEKREEIFVIRPPVTPGIKRIEKDGEILKELYDLGYKTAKENLDKLKRYLKEV